MKPQASTLELWAGVECTLNRVGENFVDQMALNGHRARPEDLDRFAALGLKTLRYPVLWEHVSPDVPDQSHWQGSDQALARLRALGIGPIVGLLHHGSGPRYTDLADSEFPQKLSAYAGRVAARYPWVTRYTPVNEPLTTARFSGLYGHWYPHSRDPHEFLSMLFHQVWGTVLAMRAIRTVQPAAELIFTEDLGEVSSTPFMAYQAAHENARRWLSMDLLAGHVVPGHRFYNRFLAAGVRPASLEALAQEPCLPAVFGVNHYLTSNRFLDERLERYPAHYHGGNGRDAYADVSSVVVAEGRDVDRGNLLKQAWERYRRPVALTESHVYATREDQLRWLHDAWKRAQELREQGVDVRAVTAWSLLGTFDWVSLCTRSDGVYEPGVFDLRSTPPRATALVPMIRALATVGHYEHPVLADPGWWERPTRQRYPPRTSRTSYRIQPGESLPSRPLLILGGKGTLARALGRECDRRGLYYGLLSRQELDAASADAVHKVFEAMKPWAVINAAGFVRVDDAQSQAAACQRDNVVAAVTPAEACAQRRIPFVTFSSDLVFSGDRAEPYEESSPTHPLNVYGRTKVEAEQRVAAACPEALIVRTSAFFDPWDDHNFISQTLRQLESHGVVVAASDVTVSPTYVPDLVRTVLDLMIDGEKGVWHLANAGALTWYDFAQQAARKAGLDSSRIEARPAAEMPWIARRPLYSALGSERGSLLETVDAALDHYLRDRGARRPSPSVDRVVA